MAPAQRVSWSERLAEFGFVAVLGVTYIAVSAGLIAYNKYLIHAERFPFAVPLVLLHSIFCSSLTLILYFLFPALFPSLADPAGKIIVDRHIVVGGALPIAFLFAGQLALSNTAYLHSSVAFLQMMKEANLALVYALSLAAALEHFSWRSARLLLAVMVATTMTIHGELHFSPTGFTIQGISQLFESSKIVLQAMLLSSAGRKLDALTYVLLVMPLCALVLGAICCILLMWPNPHMLTPSTSEVLAWWPHLLANALVAFALNLIIALFVKHSSAVSFILAGIVKDAMIVLSGVFVLSEVISPLQGVGFAMQLGLIFIYTLAKTFPNKFEHGMLHGIVALFLGENMYTAVLKNAACRGEKDYGACEEGALARTAGKRTGGGAAAQ